MCNKAVNSYFFLFDSIPDLYKIHEMCDRAVSDVPFMILYCPNEYIPQKMCDDDVYGCLAVLKLIADWFVTSKMIKKLFSEAATQRCS